MSDYTAAPATKLLASHCCVCARPLLDSVSVELGIGPDCRKKHGFDVAVDADAREQANVIVHRIAANQTGGQVAFDCEALRALGFGKLADRILVRVAAVKIDVTADGRYSVVTPYDPAVVDAMRTIPGRRWDRDAKLNTFPSTSKAALAEMLRRFFAGAIATGPKGAFVIEAAV